MTSRRSPSPDDPAPQSIPLQNLPRPPDGSLHVRDGSRSTRTPGFGFGHGRAASILRGGRQQEYQPLDTSSALAATEQDEGLYSPDDAHVFATAQMGLSYADSFNPSHEIPSIITTSADQDVSRQGSDDRSVISNDDLVPLTNKSESRSITRKSSLLSNSRLRNDRHSKRSSVSFLDASSAATRSGRGSHLGDDLPSLQTDVASRKPSMTSGISRLSVNSATGRDPSRSRSSSPSPLARAGSMLREMSERVVNISNDSEMVEQSLRRKSTVRDRQASATNSQMKADDVEAGSDVINDIGANTTLPEKTGESGMSPLVSFQRPVILPNPLHGKSLGLFGPENAIRKWLLEVFTNPAAEPIILILIVVQTVLLAINAAKHAQYMQARTRAWGESSFDYAILGIFCVYTLEIVARMIVSGFIINPREYSTLDRSQGFRKGAVQKVGSLFSMYDKPTPTSSAAHERRASVEFHPSIVRSFTGLPIDQGPGHGRQKQRTRLARRAFLRHSFNRLDFLAVVSFWIAFSLQVAGYDTLKHVYAFNMLSCLRILRLLGLTSGTTIILRSLKKAAPLLVNIAFLIGFFWLIFGIVGVQSFKSSFRRTCVWIGDDGSGQNYTQNIAPENIQFCGGYLDASTALPMPWLRADGSNGTRYAKGFICPQNSLCVENSTNPYNNTISFDNIIQSMELVFVVISSNTWSDLMYYLAASDYLISALFFAIGIVVLSLWLVNLLIAVITSSFQVIREESKQSAFTAKDMDDAEQDNVPTSGRVSQFRKLVDKTKWFWIFAITFNTVTMCLRSSSMSVVRTNFIMDTETVVTLLLDVEIILRIASDWRRFHKSRCNWIDLLLAIITTIMQIPPIRNSGQPYAWLSIFQIARIYRVVLAVPLTRDLVMIVFRNAIGLFNLIVFVVLFTFLASIMASQLFRGDIPAADNSGTVIQIQFYDIWNSFIGMYIIFSSENWTTILYNITQFDVSWDTAWLGAAFIIMWFIMANLIVLNMFIAVIQESFDVSEDEKRLQQVKAFLKQKESSSTSGGNVALSAILRLGRDSSKQRDNLEYGGATLEQLMKDAVVTDFLDSETNSKTPRPLSAHLTSLPKVQIVPSFAQRLWAKLNGYDENDPNPFYARRSMFRANEEFDSRAVAKQVASTTESRRKLWRQYLNRHPRYNVSLFIFKVNNPIRRTCQYLVGPSRGNERPEGVEPWKPAWYAFSAFTYMAIVAMVVIACITTPLYQKQTFSNQSLYDNWLVWADLAFAIVFTVEALIKIIADGFFDTPNAFFRSIWGLIDVVVLVSLWISVITTLYEDDAITRGVGALKALRALRLLNISDSARNTFHSVIVVGGYKVISAAFVSLSLLVPFAILGVNLFNGTFESCNDNSFNGLLNNCVGEYNSTPFNNNWPVLAPHTVSNPWYSFDNFGSSLFILFQIVSQEGWTNVLQSGMNVVGIGQQPQSFNSPGNAVFFIVFNLLGAVFVLTLFISVFMRNYTEQTGVAFLTADQRSWLELRKLLKQISPTKKSLTNNTTSFQKWCYDIASKKKGKWPRFVTTVLLAHLGLLVIEFYPEPRWWERLREFIFLAFTLILMANVMVRIIGLTWDRFRRSSWDMYALFVVSGTFITLLLAVSQFRSGTLEQLYKLFLVSITFLLIPRNNQLDQLFKTAAASFNLIANLLATWFVLFLVFAIALTQAFSLTRFGPNENSNVNFRNVPKALILLFRMSIGEGWNQIMEDFATIKPPYCVNGNSFFNSDCGSEGWARGLLVAWNLVSMYIFTSLFVSLIFESFSYVYQRSGGLQIVSREELRKFKMAWSEFDPKGTGYISKELFPRLLGELSGVFQMRIYDGDFTVRNLIEDCSVEPGDSTAGRKIVAGIDLALLNARLNQIPIAEIRARRQQMNLFYHEMLLSADPHLGISFTSTIMILAHYNVISDGKSLRLEEFLRRKVRLQRVRDTIRRGVILDFIRVVHHQRRFRKHISYRRNSTMDGPLQLAVPEIFVENLEESDDEAVAPRDFTETERTPLSPRRGIADIPRIVTNDLPGPGSSRRSTRTISPGSSPILSPNRLTAVDTSYHGGRRSVEGRRSIEGRDRSPPLTPTLGGHSRQGSTVSSRLGVEGVAESFDASAWGESLRRSFTKKRSDT